VAVSTGLTVLLSAKLAVKNMFDVNIYIKVLLSAKLAFKKNVKRKVG